MPPVTRADLEAELHTLEGADPVGGLFGPGSMMWTVGRESVVLLAGGRAALLQLAHPAVAHAIVQHSKVFDDLALRFRRTLGHMYAMTFGARDEALAMARRIHTVHTHIRGTVSEAVGRFRPGDAYQANDPAALLWVAATLWDSSIDIFERTVRPLTEEEQARYWEEARRFSCLFGYSHIGLPKDWAGFRRYWDAMITSDTLAVSETTHSVVQRILTPPRRAAAPMYHWLKILTAGLLPPRFQRDFELPFGPIEQASFAASITALRHGLPLLPASLRYTPTYLRAARRVAGREGGDPVAGGLRRLALRLLDKPKKRPA